MHGVLETFWQIVLALLGALVIGGTVVGLAILGIGCALFGCALRLRLQLEAVRPGEWRPCRRAVIIHIELQN